MKLSPLPFSKLRSFLLELGFAETRESKGWRFEHADSDTIFLFRPYRLNEKVNYPNLLNVQSMLDWRGFMTPDVFEERLIKISA